MVAGCLDEENVQKLQSESSSRLHAVKLDVTNKEELDQTYKWVKESLKDKGKNQHRQLLYRSCNNRQNTKPSLDQAEKWNCF